MLSFCFNSLQNFARVCCFCFWKRKSQQPATRSAAESLQSCLTLLPHRRQPTRLPRPWDSPGKNAGVGCHCLLLATLDLLKRKGEQTLALSFSSLKFPLKTKVPVMSIRSGLWGGDDWRREVMSCENMCPVKAEKSPPPIYAPLLFCLLSRPLLHLVRWSWLQPTGSRRSPEPWPHLASGSSHRASSLLLSAHFSALSPDLSPKLHRPEGQDNLFLLHCAWEN